MRTSRPCRWEKNSGVVHLERCRGALAASSHLNTPKLAVGRQGWMMRWMLGCTLQFLTCGMSRQVALLQGSWARLLLLFFNSLYNSNMNHDLEAVWHILVSRKLWLMTDQHGEPCIRKLVLLPVRRCRGRWRYAAWIVRLMGGVRRKMQGGYIMEFG